MGMKPRSPIDCLLASPTGVECVSVDSYVADLVSYLKKVPKYVDEKHSLIPEDSQRAKYRELGPGGALSVGDYCFVKRQPVPGTSKRFQHPNHDQVFMITRALGDGSEAKSYYVSDLMGNADNLGFSQPVAAERLTYVEMLPMTQPSTDTPTRLIISDRGRDREAEIKAQCMDGRVKIQYSDEEIEHMIDLSQCKYEWL